MVKKIIYRIIKVFLIKCLNEQTYLLDKLNHYLATEANFIYTYKYQKLQLAINICNMKVLFIEGVCGNDRR